MIDIGKTIAKRAAALLKDNTAVNLGIGIPTLVGAYVDPTRKIIFQSENGILGMGEQLGDEYEDPDVYNAGSKYVRLAKGAMFMDSAMTFGLIRGGHIDSTILGALQVDEQGNLANWIIPNKMIAGIGGAVDLLSGVNTVIVAMEHSAKGKPKVLKNCTFPLTGYRCVNFIITEMGLMEITDDGIVLRELAEAVTLEEIQAVTEAELIIPDNLTRMPVVEA